jgi:hypothetical protein
MKIRINGNSIRLRLSQSEVSDFVRKGEVSSTCSFVNGILTYRIVLGSFDSLTADIVDSLITVYVPSSLAEKWDMDGRVGFDVHDNSGLYILVEKDFQCLKPRSHEDESGLFPNPQAIISSYD